MIPPHFLSLPTEERNKKGIRQGERRTVKTKSGRDLPDRFHRSNCHHAHTFNGDIFSVFESLTRPFHQLCMTALEPATVRTTLACRRIVKSICSSCLSNKGVPRGKARPGILCRPPPQINGQPGLCLSLKGTFDGHGESTLPEVYKEFVVVVATGPFQKGDQDQFYVRTVPEWQTSDPEKTQWCITLPLTSRTGVIPTDRWICFGPPDVPFTVEPMQLKKLIDYSRARLRDFF